MTVAAIEGLAAVGMVQGRVAIWVGEPDDAHGVALWPAAALEAAKDILALIQDDVPSFTGVIEHITVAPPAAPGMSGCLRFTVSGRTIDLLIAWDDLVGLSQTAGDALMAASPEGQG